MPPLPADSYGQRAVLADAKLFSPARTNRPDLQAGTGVLAGCHWGSSAGKQVLIISACTLMMFVHHLGSALLHQSCSWHASRQDHDRVRAAAVPQPYGVIIGKVTVCLKQTSIVTCLVARNAACHLDLLTVS